MDSIIQIGRHRVKLAFASKDDLWPGDHLYRAVLEGTGYPLPLEMEKWLYKVCGDEADFCVVAVCEGDIVGFVRWSMNRECQFLQGTFVAHGFRSKGLGKAMWKLALENFDESKKIEVVTTSFGGQDLIDSLAHEHENFSWDIDTNL